MSQLWLQYRGNDGKQRAIVKLRIYEDDPMLYFDVSLKEIPIEDSGKEVTVNFKVLEIENKGEFFTD